MKYKEMLEMIKVAINRPGISYPGSTKADEDYSTASNKFKEVLWKYDPRNPNAIYNSIPKAKYFNNSTNKFNYGQIENDYLDYNNALQNIRRNNELKRKTAFKKSKPITLNNPQGWDVIRRYREQFPSNYKAPKIEQIPSPQNPNITVPISDDTGTVIGNTLKGINDIAEKVDLENKALKATGLSDKAKNTKGWLSKAYEISEGLRHLGEETFREKKQEQLEPAPEISLKNIDKPLTIKNSPLLTDPNYLKVPESISDDKGHNPDKISINSVEPIIESLDNPTAILNQTTNKKLNKPLKNIEKPLTPIKEDPPKSRNILGTPIDQSTIDSVINKFKKAKDTVRQYVENNKQNIKDYAKDFTTNNTFGSHANERQKQLDMVKNSPYDIKRKPVTTSSTQDQDTEQFNNRVNQMIKNYLLNGREDLAKATYTKYFGNRKVD